MKSPDDSSAMPMPDLPVPTPDEIRLPSLRIDSPAALEGLRAGLLDRLDHLDDQGLRDSCEADDAEDALDLIPEGQAQGFPRTVRVASSNALRAFQRILEPPIPGIQILDPDAS